MRPTTLLLALVAGVALGGIAMWSLMRRDASPEPGRAPADSQVLYWYDPMVPGQHFDKPGKSPFMDMALVPKLAGSGGDDGVVRIDPRTTQNLGLRTARAERGVLHVTMRATGAIAFDERETTAVQARVGGIVERLAVRSPLASVRAGETLMSLLAPDWTAAQEEYLSLRRTRAPGLDALRAAARQRLLLLGMGESQLRAIEHDGRTQLRVAIIAPRDGVVGELAVRDGATVVAGSPLLTINGLDTVWLDARIPESDVGRVGRPGMAVVELPAFPGERFEGRWIGLLPNVDAGTRTQTARIVLDNRDHRLAPGMFARVEFGAADRAARILVPSEAVIATGTRSVVIVAEGGGRFRAQEVRVGDEADGRAEVVAGLAEGDDVVLSGQFLIDSEASLSSALARLAGDVAAADPSHPAAASPTWDADGTLERIDGTRWTIATDAIPALDMAAMRMTFVVRTDATPSPIAPGLRVRFSFRRDADGDFEIVRIAGARP